MSKPTMGRIVWYSDGHREWPAIITSVPDEEVVDLHVLGVAPSEAFRFQVSHKADRSRHSWRWPPRDE